MRAARYMFCAGIGAVFFSKSLAQSSGGYHANAAFGFTGQALVQLFGAWPLPA